LTRLLMTICTFQPLVCVKLEIFLSCYTDFTF